MLARNEGSSAAFSPKAGITNSAKAAQLMRPNDSPELGALFDLSARTKLRLSGGDRLRYLNGQISNDLRKVSDDFAIHACVLNQKGKINADVFIVADADSFLIDTEPGMSEQLTVRLDRYIIADDVQIEDVSEQFALFHVLGVEAPAAPDSLRTATVGRFGAAGTDLWFRSDQHDSALQELAGRVAVCNEARAETFRIERGLPRWGQELTEEIIPTEANLETDAIDYAKGCYIGQEVISRIKMSGQTNKRLCGLVATTDAALSAGMRLITTAGDGKDVGWITSVTTSPRIGKQIALGFVKRGFQTVGTLLDARTEGSSATSAPRVQIALLPFQSEAEAD